MATMSIGRNQACPCGSGRKYKHCCLNSRANAGASVGPALPYDATAAEAHAQRGVLLAQRGKLQEAAQSFRRAIGCDPRKAIFHANLGTVLAQLRQFGEALPCFQAALRLQPGYYHAHKQLGSVLNELGRHNAAVAIFRSLLLTHPADPQLHYNLAHSLHQRASYAEAIASYERALALDPHDTQAYSNLLYLHASTNVISGAAQCELAVGWQKAALSDAERQAARARVFANPPRANRRLKLGIVSAEFGDHAVSEFLEPFLQQLDRDRFHVSLFSTFVRREARCGKFEALADEWVPLVAFSDADAAAQIRAQQIDLLMDTTGHTVNGRLGIFAHRAAPVQLSYLGYFGTTGLTEMDWVISDHQAPASCDSHFRERVWRLSRFPACYRGDPSLGYGNWRPDPSGTIWLGSFNRYSKIADATFDLWSQVLHALPAAKLLLEDRHADENDAHARILGGLQKRGIAPERVVFEPYVRGHERHMDLYERLDLALDTIPYNSGTTACDALWMGVPVIALEGNTPASRMAAGFVRAAEHPEWVATGPEHYVRIAAALAQDTALRQRLRRQQRQQMAASPLCDAQALTRALEQAYEQMFDRWQGRV